MNDTIVTTFRLTPKAYRASMRQVADLWDRATNGGEGAAPVGGMRACIAHVACYSGGCVAVEHRSGVQ